MRISIFANALFVIILLRKLVSKTIVVNIQIRLTQGNQQNDCLVSLLKGRGSEWLLSFFFDVSLYSMSGIT